MANPGGLSQSNGRGVGMPSALRAAAVVGVLSGVVMPGYRVLVCGGRDFMDADWLFGVLDHYHRAGAFECVIQGCARGADTLAGEWADARNVPVLPFPADWNNLGNSAGPIRNAQMLREGRPTFVVAFPGRHGTEDMKRQARRAGVPVLEIPRRG